MLLCLQGGISYSREFLKLHEKYKQSMMYGMIPRGILLLQYGVRPLSP